MLLLLNKRRFVGVVVGGEERSSGVSERTKIYLSFFVKEKRDGERRWFFFKASKMESERLWTFIYKIKQ